MKREAIIAELRDLQAYAYGAEARAESRAEKDCDETDRKYPELTKYRDASSRAHQLGALQASLEHIARRLDALAEQIQPLRATRRRRAA